VLLDQWAQIPVASSSPPVCGGRGGFPVVRLTAALLLSLAAGCFGSGAEQQESSYKYKLEKLQKLSTRADGDLKGTIDARSAAFEKEHAALPQDAKARDESCGKLNQAMTAALQEFDVQVEEREKRAGEATTAAGAKAAAEAKQADDASRLQRIAVIAGTWQREGILLEIAKDGTVHYRAVKGGATKEFTAPIKSIDAKSFVVGAFGLSTTFQFDAPHTLDGRVVMTVDGNELTRSP